MKGSLVLITLILAVFLCSAGQCAAQNMSDTVVTKTVKFAKGTSEATERGTAKYAMSYVYEFTAKKGQTMSVALTGDDPELTFSIIPPDGATLDEVFGVKKWAGKLTQTGKWALTLVMNNEKSRGVPYTLKIKIT